MKQNDPSLKTAEFNAAKKLSVYGTTDRGTLVQITVLAHGLRKEQKIIPARQLVLESSRDRHAIKNRIDATP